MKDFIEKTLQEPETAEHFVTVIGIMATESDDKWFTPESFKDAVKYAEEWKADFLSSKLQELADKQREEAIEKVVDILLNIREGARCGADWTQDGTKMVKLFDELITKLKNNE